jgi:glycine reductase
VVKDRVVFSYENQVLEVDETALIDLVLQDPRITDASLAVAMPGEKTRITGIRDIVEPRHKVLGSGEVFPGILGPIEDVGDGRTHRLSGMTVVAAAEYEGTIRAGTTVQRRHSGHDGPRSGNFRFSSLLHLVLSFRIVPGLAELRPILRFNQQNKNCPPTRPNYDGTVTGEDRHV